MDFKIPDTIVPDWRGPDEGPARGMNDQIWEVLESLSGPAEIAALMQGIRLIDEASCSDGTVDRDEWQQVAQTMQTVFGPVAQASQPDRATRIYRAFELRAEALRGES